MDTHIHKKVSNSININPFFYLLQISDPMLPIGGYTQSYGLETYVQKGIVHDADSSWRYLESYIRHNFLYNDLLAVKLSWDYADVKDLEGLCRLESLLSAAKSPRELRNASEKLGLRFSKVVESVLSGNILFDSFVKLIKSGRSSGHHSVMYGFSARLFEIDKVSALSAFTYSMASSIINNCAKLVPISQKDGQDILFNSQAIFQEVVDNSIDLDEESIGICCFGFDIRAMQHERLYSRLYIS